MIEVGSSSPFGVVEVVERLSKEALFVGVEWRGDDLELSKKGKLKGVSKKWGKALWSDDDCQMLFVSPLFADDCSQEDREELAKLFAKHFAGVTIAGLGWGAPVALAADSWQLPIPFPEFASWYRRP